MAMSDTLQSLLEGFEKSYGEAREANLKRYGQAMSIYDEIIARYQPGGAFQKSALGQLEKQKVKDVGREKQDLISSGMFGTTTFAGVGRGWEESVGAPSRLKLEDVMMQRLSQAQVGKVGVMEGREDEYPDYGTIAQLAGAIGQGGTSGGGGGAARSQAPYSTNAAGLTSLPGRSGSTVTPATTQRGGAGGEGAGSGEGNLSDIRMGAGYGPTYQTAGEMSGVISGVARDVAAENRGASYIEDPGAGKKQATTQSELMQYERYKKGLKRTGISAVANFETWYKANKGTGATKYLTAQAAKKSSGRAPSRKLGYSPYGAGGF